MAERRMFAKTIIDSDSFLDMPLSTQALYFHLSMRADDDGFVNSPKKICKMIGSSDDEMTILFAKKFLIGFESGVVVIKHWRIHNYIQKDRKKDTTYHEEMGLLEIDKNNGYTLDTSCTPSIGKVRLGEDRLVENNNMCASLTAEVVSDLLDYPKDFLEFWKAYPKKVGKDKAAIAWHKKKHKPSIELILEAVQRYKFSKTVRDGFTCNPTTWINEGRWSDEVELSDYDKAKAIQEHTGMSSSDLLAIQIEQAQRQWEIDNQ